MRNVEKSRESSTLENFLENAGTFNKVDVAIAKRVIARLLAKMMREKYLTKSMMAKRMRVTPAALDRLLNPNSLAITPLTLHKAASAVGKRLYIGLEDAA